MIYPCLHSEYCEISAFAHCPTCTQYAPCDDGSYTEETTTEEHTSTIFVNCPDCGNTFRAPATFPDWQSKFNDFTTHCPHCNAFVFVTDCNDLNGGTDHE